MLFRLQGPNQGPTSPQGQGQGLTSLPITGCCVCSNSIECATNTSRTFALAWQLDSLWCFFCRRCTSGHLTFQPVATAHCDWRPGARASRYDDRVYIVSCAPRFHEICYVIRINTNDWNEWWWWWQTYMRYSGNDLRLIGHSWRRPVIA